MITYKIIIAYDGTDYFGWQIQPEAVTVTSVLQDRFKYVFEKDIKIIGASRTDAGVHALGQVAKFTVDFDINQQDLLRAWNNALPRDILIRKIELVSSDFHPQANVFEKTYHYYFSLKKPLPFVSRYVYYAGSNLDFNIFKQALNIFVGTHDFRSFTTGYEQSSTIRTINNIEINYLKKFNLYRVEFTGKSFLRYMIRRIIGASLDIATDKKRNIDELIVALRQKNPEQNFTNSPAQGLVLYKIKYL